MSSESCHVPNWKIRKRGTVAKNFLDNFLNTADSQGAAPLSPPPLRVTSKVTRSGCRVKSLYLDPFLLQTKSFILLFCPDFLPPRVQRLFQGDYWILAREPGYKSRCPSVQRCRMSPSAPFQRPRGVFATGTDKGLITVSGKCWERRVKYKIFNSFNIPDE